MIRVTLPIEPVAKERPRMSMGRVYTPAKTANFEREVALWLRKLLGPTAPRTVPLKLVARFILIPPKRPKWTVPAVRPDLDNYLKALKDGANGVLWLDDAQVVHVDAKKLYAMDGSAARIEIEVTEVTQ
jgi:Holliday junction resolvase RusA-like endonuclease